MPDTSPAVTDHQPTALEAAQAGQASAESAANALMVSERQYRRLFEAARDGILILDSDQGRVTDANPFMTELLGYSHDELLGKELWEIGLLKDKAASLEAFRQLKRDGFIRYEDLPLANQQGEWRQVEFVSNLYRENGHIVIQCNIRDITERKQAAAELAELAASVANHGRQAAVLEERTRMAREIHDTLAQGFTGIMTQLQAAEAALSNAPETVTMSNIAGYQVQLTKVQVRIGKALNLARESLVEARRSVASLRSAPLETDSLSTALDLFLSHKVLDMAAKGHYVLEGIPYPLPVTIEHCLLRIGQEAIANAVEHAQALQIDVTLAFEPEQLRLRVQDNGQGFDDNLIDAGRFGIIGMKERAEKAQGLFTIVSHAGQGTEVDLIVPVVQDAPADWT